MSFFAKKKKETDAGNSALLGQLSQLAAFMDVEETVNQVSKVEITVDGGMASGAATVNRSISEMGNAVERDEDPTRYRRRPQIRGRYCVHNSLPLSIPAIYDSIDVPRQG